MSQNYSYNGNGSGSGDAVNNDGGIVGCNGGGPCGACRFLKRKCWPQCIYAPFFDSDQGIVEFSMVHKVFGASNVSKLLQIIPLCKRRDAVNTLIYEALARLRDPIYGCVGEINALQQQVTNLKEKVSCLEGQLAMMNFAQQLPPPPPQTTVATQAFSVDDLQPPTTLAWSTPTPTTYDLSSVFNPLAQTSWAMQQWAMDSQQQSAAGTSGTTGDGDLHALASQFMLSNETPAPPVLPYSNASSFPFPSFPE